MLSNCKDSKNLNRPITTTTKLSHKMQPDNEIIKRSRFGTKQNPKSGRKLDIHVFSGINLHQENNITQKSHFTIMDRNGSKQDISSVLRRESFNSQILLKEDKTS
jgi:hypothetical protein